MSSLPLGEYPSFARVSRTTENAGLGMQIVFDTYTQTLHDKCKKVYDKVRQGTYGTPDSDEKTCEVYIEIVLAAVEPRSVGTFKALKEAIDCVNPQREVTLV